MDRRLSRTQTGLQELVPCVFTCGHQACSVCPGGSCDCPGSATYRELVVNPHYFCFGYRRGNEPGHFLSPQVWELQIGVSEDLFSLSVLICSCHLFCCFSLQGELTNGRSKFHVLFLLFVAVMFFVSLMFLFGYHCWLVSRNRSTLGKALMSCFSKWNIRSAAREETQRNPFVFYFYAFLLPY